ncbi:mitochondrial 37S ribosomal protein mS35 RSM24 [Sporobolomyces salmoneus]|uniref:mitochondrial 37S ribosomal protein mS35 RSM24 n=1 Tax=Sporobolomyces salmoneus TaxID=183962 RepID=UPI0031737194
MRSTAPLSLSSSLRLFARRPNSSFSSSRDPLDIANTIGPDASAFNFPLTRPSLLKMEKQRQMLHYLRLEQLQFKDLLKFRQPFFPPNASTHFIQVRHQHYQGESHPASRKISIIVPLSSLSLTPSQLHKFKLLAGPRFTPSTDGPGEGTFKLSCELYPSEKMNEKWCSDTLDKLLSEAKDSTKDGFEDVPLDFRGVKKRIERKGKGKKTVGMKDFPREWLRPRSMEQAN